MNGVLKPGGFAGVIPLFGVLVLLGLTACDETVNPFVDANRFYTIYGYLDTGSDTQYVRVIPLRRVIGESGREEIDAAVTSTSAENGETIVWRDSVFHMADGSVGHVFYAPLRPIPEWTYRFEVERSDGISAWAETTVPPAEIATVMDPTPSGVVIDQRVIWDGVDFPPFRVEVWYRFVNTLPDRPFREAVVIYDDVGVAVEDDDWEVLVRLTRDRAQVSQLLGVSENARLTLLGVGMRLAISDEQWRPPGGVFDREILVQPGTFSNVRNGFGFFGAVNQYTVEWALTRETIDRLGYGFPGKGARSP